jgi:hypothetical protein
MRLTRVSAGCCGLAGHSARPHIRDDDAGLRHVGVQTEKAVLERTGQKLMPALLQKSFQLCDFNPVVLTTRVRSWKLSVCCPSCQVRNAAE